MCEDYGPMSPLKKIQNYEDERNCQHIKPRLCQKDFPLIHKGAETVGRFITRRGLAALG